MRSPSHDRPPAARAVAIDPEQLRTRSILIYVRSSLVLTLLLYALILTMLYSDLYVHLIRQARDTFRHLRVLPGPVLIVVAATALFYALRMKSLLERAALVIFAMNFACLFLRRKMIGHSEAYLTLCFFSLLLDVAFLATVIAFYRKYPNLLTYLRRKARE